MVWNKKVKNAFAIGILCSISYLAVYFARNILGAVTPQMVANGDFTESYIGGVSSLYFIFYAVGQLVNGVLGDKIKARYMISFGLGLAGVTNILFYYLIETPNAAMLAYGMTGFFLSMIYGPMTKVVAENTEPVYATRCSLGYTFSSFFGSPLAGVAAAALTWQSVFGVSSVILFVMAAMCFVCFLFFEKKGIVKYNQYAPPQKQKGGSIRLLIQHRIIKFTLISVITGVIRTSVVFWLPTYISQHLGFPADKAAMLFTVATFFISLTTFVAIFVYERLNRNMDLTILLMFSVAAAAFLLVFLLHQPALNLIFMVAAIMASNSAATMLWSRYCPSLRDTGMVSGATGFLDFVSYMAAAASSALFANAVSAIGWGPLIMIWMALMICGVIVALPWDKIREIKAGKPEVFRYEMHCHTEEVSACATVAAKDLVDVYKKAGYAGVVITDHFLNGNTVIAKDLPWAERIERYTKSYELAKERGDAVGIDVFFGLEFSYMGTDFLAYGIDKAWLLAHENCDLLSVSEFCDLVHESGGYVVQAHPFREAGYIEMIRLLPRKVDAVEIYNAQRTVFENKMAAEYAKNYNLIPFCGSDNHHGIIESISALELDFRAESVTQIMQAVVEKRHKIGQYKLEADGTLTE